MSQDDCVILPLALLIGAPDEYSGSARRFVTRMCVEGWWAPRILLNYDGLVVHNIKTGRVYFPRRCYYIPWSTAWVLRRRVLKGEYISTLVLHSECYSVVDLEILRRNGPDEPQVLEQTTYV